MSELITLPEGWTITTIDKMITKEGFFKDGDWVESKDQDPLGTIRLTQLADIKKLEFKIKSNRFITKNKVKELNCTLLEKNDILIARMPKPLGRSCIFTGDEFPCITVVDVAIIRTNQNPINSFWLMYMINSPQIHIDIEKLQTGTTRKRISRTNLNKIQFLLPPLNEQKRIVSKIEELFSELDHTKDTLQKVKLQLVQYRQSLLKSAFEGKLTEKWRKENPYNVKNIQKNKKIPKEWDICNLEDLSFKINSGFPSGKHNKTQSGIPHIRPMNIDINGNIDLSVVKYVENNSKDKLLKNDVLFNNTNSPKLLGKTALIKENTNWGYSNHMTRIRLDNSLVESSWIAIYLHKLFKEGFYKRIAKNHVNQSSVNSTELSKKIPIIIAPLNEQQEIISQLEQRFSLIENTEFITNTMLKQLETLRSSILKQAFDGKLVPQDPNDEPAEKLLQRIKEQKSRGKK